LTSRANAAGSMPSSTFTTRPLPSMISTMLVRRRDDGVTEALSATIIALVAQW
jgi:hypothetical protein